VTIHIRSLGSEDLGRISEIDRSEEIEVEYVQDGEQLIAQPATMTSVPDFFPSGESHSVPELIETWRPVVLAGGSLIGAFEGSTLVGMALLGAELSPGVLQLALLYVSRPHRRNRVATALMEELESRAREAGARALYVSAVPTDSAVGFYLAHGFSPTVPLPGPFEEEPDDIHMLMPLVPTSPPAGGGSPRVPG